MPLHPKWRCIGMANHQNRITDLGKKPTHPLQQLIKRNIRHGTTQLKNAAITCVFTSVAAACMGMPASSTSHNAVRLKRIELERDEGFMTYAVDE
ncbi:MAG: hypothetical protein WA777_16990 [Rhodanobacter sp.]